MKSTILNHRRKARGVSSHVHRAAADWYAKVRGLVEELLLSAERVQRECERPGSSLGLVLDAGQVRALAGVLGLASSRVADIAPKTGVVLPDPVKASCQ